LRILGESAKMVDQELCRDHNVDMIRQSLHHALRRLGPLAPFVILAVASLLAAGFLSSCGRERPAVRPTPFVHPGAPIIRVRITPEPVASARIATTGGYRVLVDGRSIAHSTDRLEAAVVRRSGGAWSLAELTFTGREMEILPDEGEYVTVDSLSYRGNLRLLPRKKDRLIVINVLDVESYLAGVLSRELYPSWSPQVYRALAVAARTFAIYHMKTFGLSHEYDLGATQATQVYGGLSAESAKSRSAVRATAGQVLYVVGTDGRRQIFEAQYSACCGGYVNGASVIRDAADIEPLRGGQRCDHCGACPLFRWPRVSVAKADLYAAVRRSYPQAEELGGVRTVRVVSSSPSGRAVWVDVVGMKPDTSIRLRAEDLRLALLRSGVCGPKQLASMNCKISDAGRSIEFSDGRGFGHGVGLCQWGAQGKAAQGWVAEQILAFYYPGAAILAAY